MGEFNPIEFAEQMREKLKELEEIARNGIRSIIRDQEDDKYGNKGEVIAQATLGMRHIEDARMKYGKVIQYTGDGISKFDK